MPSITMRNPSCAFTMKGILVCILILYGAAATQSTQMIQNCSVQYRSVPYGRDYSNTKDVNIQEGECHAEYAPSNDTNREDSTSCLTRCIAKRKIYRELSLLKIIESRPSVAECRVSTDHCNSCHLTSSHHTFYLNQPSFKKTVNLGSCVGTCSDGNRCLPTATDSIAILGPNGFRTETQITKCDCIRPQCQRHQYLMEVTVPHSNTTKIVDIGRCVGECIGEKTTICLPIGRDPCGFQFQVPANLCAPSLVHMKFGVDVVKKCGCRTRKNTN